MVVYSVTTNATSNTVVNTEDTFVELSAVIIKVKRVEVRLGDGTGTAGVDNDFRVRLVRKTAGGATGTAGTAVRLKQEDRTSGATVTVKNGTAAFTTATLGDIVYTQVVNGRQQFQWIPRDDDEVIQTHTTLGSGGMFAVLIQSSVVSQKFQVNVLWAE
jgi:hypothetical protein